jgi:alpha-tubulin suppressor-like RCC1 family protein
VTGAGVRRGIIAPCLLGCFALGCAAPSAMPAAGANVAPPATATAPPRVVDLQWGGSYCALFDDGRVACWGRNRAASLGDGTIEARNRPSVLAGIDRVRQLRGLPNQGFCALRDDASLWCWGFGHAGDVTVPIAPVTPAMIARDVAAFGFTERSDSERPSWRGVCARHFDGSIACTEFKTVRSGPCAYWADAQRSKCLAEGHTVERRPHAPPLEPGNVHYDDNLPIPTVTLRLCELRGRQVFCRGRLLGDPDRDRSDDYVPVTGLDDVVQISDNTINVCAVRASGTLVCWGRDADHELVVDPDPTPCRDGSQTEPCLRRPTTLPVADVVQVVKRGPNLFVITRAGDLLAASAQGSEPGPRPALSRVEGLPPLARAVPAHSPPMLLCALSKTDQVYCYGSGSDLGNGEQEVSRTPVPIPGVHGAVEVHVSADLDGACARVDDGRVICWGTRDYPVGLPEISELGEACALASDRRVWCWGANYDGEMGIGRLGRPHAITRAGLVDPDVPHVPLPVPGLKDVVALSGYLGTTCTADRAGEVRCWGTWAPRMRTTSPTRINGLPPVDEVMVGSNHCVLGRDRTVWCWWGANPPAQVPGLTGIAHLPSYGPGAGHDLNSPNVELCAIGDDRALRCVNTPAPLPAIAGVRQVSVADGALYAASRGCAVLDGGELRCWGPPYCAAGSALCVNDIWNHVETVLDRVKQVAVGPSLSCAVRTDGTVWCWGTGTHGGLGGRYPVKPHVAKVEFGAGGR